MKLCRSHDDRQIAGVCGGLAENLDWDSGRLRMVWGLTALGTGGGAILVCLALWYLMPEEPPPLQPWEKAV